MAGTLVYGRCNPYGAETGGPKRLLGGLYGPNSAQTPSMDLPANVEQGEWPCDCKAEVRCRMLCRCGHKGQIMQLCSWHDEVNYTTANPEGEAVRVHGHYEEIQRRQADFCPACAYPDARHARNGIDYAALQKEWDGIGTALHIGWEQSGYSMQFFRSPHVRSLQQRRADIGSTFDEARMLGIVHNCKLQLIPVS